MKQEFSVNAYIDKVERISGANAGTLTVTDEVVEYKSEGLIGKSDAKNFCIPIAEISAVKHLSGSMFVIVRSNSKVYYIQDIHMAGISMKGVSNADADIIASINEARHSDSSNIPSNLLSEIEKTGKSNKTLTYIGIAIIVIYLLYNLFS